MRRLLRRGLTLAALGAALSCAPSFAQEAASALRADALRAEPFADAKSLAQVGKGDALIILGRQGGWYQVKAGGKTGWIRMLSVRRGQSGQRNAGAELGGVADIATGRAGTGQVVSATGVRGLSEEDLKQAKFNEAEVAKAESNRVSAADAKAFARRAKLEVNNIAFLPDPKEGGRK